MSDLNFDSLEHLQYIYQNSRRAKMITFDSFNLLQPICHCHHGWQMKLRNVKFVIPKSYMSNIFYYFLSFSRLYFFSIFSPTSWSFVEDQIGGRGRRPNWRENKNKNLIISEIEANSKSFLPWPKTQQRFTFIVDLNPLWILCLNVWKMRGGYSFLRGI